MGGGQDLKSLWFGKRSLARYGSSTNSNSKTKMTALIIFVNKRNAVEKLVADPMAVYGLSASPAAKLSRAIVGAEATAKTTPQQTLPPAIREWGSRNAIQGKRTTRGSF